MTKNLFQEIPLLISCSQITTEINRTGEWRFVRPVYDEKTAPCSAACPAGEDIARIEMLASRGMFGEACQTILMENPLPAVCGRVCFHPCERACNRGGYDQPVAIHQIERFIGDMAISEEWTCRSTLHSSGAKPRRIAVAGSGPAGLSAAYFLARLGYECDIFEAERAPGGILRWGIPAYRLPEHILNREIDRILALGVNIFCKRQVTQDFLNSVKETYSAVFIACGYGRSVQMGIPGEAMANDGLKLLHDIRNGKTPGLEGTAAVIGGGNTAIDVARSLIRLGVKPVLVYRRRRADMPAFGHELETALKEGVRLKELVTPIRMKANMGEILLTLQKMKPVDLKDGTRPRVIPDSDKTETMKVQQVFTAIGADANENWYLPPMKEERSFPPPTAKTKGKLLVMSHCTLIRQYLPMVFGGDLTNPVKSVADAIASGKQAALALDTFFRNGWDAIEEKLAECRVGTGPSLSMEIYLGENRKNRNPYQVSFEDINTDYFQPADRVNPVALSPVESIRSFSETEQTFSESAASEEAGRCFNCGICNDCDNCLIFCPEIAVLRRHETDAHDSPLASRRINFDYCKGCGICVVECPRNAISLEEEK